MKERPSREFQLLKNQPVINLLSVLFHLKIYNFFEAVYKELPNSSA